MPKASDAGMPPIAIKNAVAKMNVNSRLMIGGVNGLHLRKHKNGASWFVRATVNGKRCDIGLGSYPSVGIADAREAARIKHGLIVCGTDPIAAKREVREAARKTKDKKKTVRECGDAYVAKNEPDWSNPKHRQQWKNTLATYVFPTIGSKHVDTVTADDIEALLEPIWQAKPETAKRVRGRIEAIFDYAKSKGYRDGDNPAAWKGNLRERLGKAKHKVKHHAALPYADLGAFMADLRGRDGTAARALEFAILCCSRSGEVRGATWAEFDLDRRLWTIPAERMKADREHVVPLSDAAVALLRAEAAKPRLVGVVHAFPAPRGGALSDMSLTAVLKRMGRGDLTQHGFRSTFREWAGEISGHPREVVEHALAHRLADKAEAAYQRGSLLPKRVLLMDDFARFCALMPTGDNVHSLKAA